MRTQQKTDTIHQDYIRFTWRCHPKERYVGWHSPFFRLRANEDTAKITFSWDRALQYVHPHNNLPQNQPRNHAFGADFLFCNNFYVLNKFKAVFLWVSHLHTVSYFIHPRFHIMSWTVLINIQHQYFYLAFLRRNSDTFAKVIIRYLKRVVFVCRICNRTVVSIPQ